MPQTEFLRCTYIALTKKFLISLNNRNTLILLIYSGHVKQALYGNPTLSNDRHNTPRPGRGFLQDVYKELTKFAQRLNKV